jgi:hypothetical protein
LPVRLDEQAFGPVYEGRTGGAVIAGARCIDRLRVHHLPCPAFERGGLGLFRSRLFRGCGDRRYPQAGQESAALSSRKRPEAGEVVVGISEAFAIRVLGALEKSLVLAVREHYGVSVI